MAGIVLIPARIRETCAALRTRIEERFPGSGLGGVARQLESVTTQAQARTERIRRPRWGLRVLVAMVLAVAVAVVAYGLVGLSLRFPRPDGWEAIQTTDAFISALVFLGAAAVFLVTLERRSKRNEALGAIEELRVLAHIVDMHQLTKDPDRVSACIIRELTLNRAALVRISGPMPAFLVVSDPTGSRSALGASASSAPRSSAPAEHSHRRPVPRALASNPSYAPGHSVVVERGSRLVAAS